MCVLVAEESKSDGVYFCGEHHELAQDRPFVIGRGGDLAIDDNPYLHRQFLQVSNRESLWWLTNLGKQLTATVADEHGRVQAWLAPGARLPLVFDRTFVWFTAGPTAYECEIVIQQAPFLVIQPEPVQSGHTTIGRTGFTPEQKLLVLALCEPVLRRSPHSGADVPTSSEAAERLGWTLTKFNRKLDNVCQKLAKSGVRGLHGGPDSLAVNRRARLVEYAVATHLVDKADLALLEHTASETSTSPGAKGRDG